MIRGGLALPRGAVLATLASLIDELHGSIHGLHWACIDSAESICACVYIVHILPALASDCYHVTSRLSDCMAIDLCLFGSGLLVQSQD